MVLASHVAKRSGLDWTGVDGPSSAGCRLNMRVIWRTRVRKQKLQRMMDLADCTLLAKRIVPNKEKVGVVAV